MPHDDLNDGYERDFPEGMDFFIRAEEALEGFAEAHHLSIEKYYRRQPVWNFVFLHPRGGVGDMQLLRVVPAHPRVSDALWVVGHWYVDDERILQRRAKHRDPPVRLNSFETRDVLAALDSELHAILAWTPAELGLPSPLQSRPRDETGKALISTFEQSLRLPKLTRD